MSRNTHGHEEEQGGDSLSWLEREVERKRKEKEAMTRVFGGAQEALKKSQESLQEAMKKDRPTDEDKGGPLFTPLTRDLEHQTEKKKAISKVFSNEQESREKRRQAMKSWLLGSDQPE